MVSNQTGHRHWCLTLLSSLKHKPDILKAQSQLEARRLEPFISDDAAVVRVYGRAEQGAHGIDKQVRIHFGLSEVSHGFTEGFQHAGNHEIAAQLQCICLPWLRPCEERLTAHGFEKRPQALHEARGTASDTQQFPGLGNIRTAEDRRAKKGLSPPRMFGRQPAGPRRAYGTGGTVSSVTCERRCQTSFAECDALHG